MAINLTIGSNSIIIKPIQRSGFKLGLEKHGFNRFPSTADYYGALPDERTGVIATGLNEKDRKELEEKLGEDLKPTSSFWDSFRITLEDKENVFDLDKPRKYLEYLVLRASKFIANSESEYKEGKYPEAKYIIQDVEAEASIKGQKYQNKLDAFMVIGAQSPTKRKQFATILLKKDFEAQKEKFIKTALMDFIESPDVARGDSQEKHIKLFNTLAAKTDDQIDVEYLVVLGTIKNVLRNRQDRYYRGDTEIGYNFDTAVEFLMSKKNADMRLQIQNELLAKTTV